MHQRDTSFQKTVTGLVAVGAVLGGMVLWFLYDSRATAWSHAAETSNNLVIALQRDIGRTMQTFDLSLQAVQRGLRTPGLDLLNLEQRRQLLFDGSTSAKHFGSVFILDVNGGAAEDSRQSPPREGNFADRDYFIVHRDRSDVGLFVSAPYKSRVSGEWSIALSRRISNPDGGFNGIVVGSIRFSYFAELFSKLDLGPGGTISLFNMDGTFIYRAPFLASLIGQDYTGATVFNAARSGETEPFEGPSRTSGQVKLYAFAPVDGLPLLLAISVPMDVVYASWYVKAGLTVLMCVMLAFAGAILVLSSRSQQARRLKAEQDVHHSAQTLRTYFDNSPDALFVVSVGQDGGLLYESCNRASTIMTGIARGGCGWQIAERDIWAGLGYGYRATVPRLHRLRGNLRLRR